MTDESRIMIMYIIIYYIDQIHAFKKTWFEKNCSLFFKMQKINTHTYVFI